MKEYSWFNCYKAFNRVKDHLLCRWSFTLSSRATVTKHNLEYEKEHDTTLPRRGTIHDMGRSMSHKTTICKKRKVERKSTSLVAQETNHSPEAVDKYTLDLDRVTFCLEKNLSVENASTNDGFFDNIEDEIPF